VSSRLCYQSLAPPAAAFAAAAHATLRERHTRKAVRSVGQESAGCGDVVNYMRVPAIRCCSAAEGYATIYRVEMKSRSFNLLFVVGMLARVARRGGSAIR